MEKKRRKTSVTAPILLRFYVTSANFSSRSHAHAISLFDLNAFMPANQEETCWNYHYLTKHHSLGSKKMTIKRTRA